MKPVLILQHLTADGPAYLAHWLGARGVPFEVVDSEAGAALPASLSGHGALAILGGEMGANDEMPMLRGAEALVREAVRDGLPTLGHCLGAQLMARALGGSVAPAAVAEIGWQPLEVLPVPAAAAWFGAAPTHTVFQWHYDQFEPPPAAQTLARSAACAHQAFALGPHLALQFHVELDAEKLQRWSLEGSPRYASAGPGRGSVQTGAEMREHAARLLADQQALAARIYARWLALAAGR